MEYPTKYIKRVSYPRSCDVCGEDATQRHTFLLPNARTNAASSGYGKDDISWCSDGDGYTCADHSERDLEMPGMRWCSTYLRERFGHMFVETHDTDVTDQVLAVLNQPTPQEQP